MSKLYMIIEFNRKTFLARAQQSFSDVYTDRTVTVDSDVSPAYFFHAFK